MTSSSPSSTTWGLSRRALEDTIIKKFAEVDHATARLLPLHPDLAAEAMPEKVAFLQKVRKELCDLLCGS